MEMLGLVFFALCQIGGGPEDGKKYGAILLHQNICGIDIYIYFAGGREVTGKIDGNPMAYCGFPSMLLLFSIGGEVVQHGLTEG